MHIAIRRYRSTGVTPDELKASMEREFLPKLSELPGFLAYYAIDSGTDKIATVSVFETPEGEQASTRLATEFVNKHFPGKLNRESLDEGHTIVDKLVTRV